MHFKTCVGLMLALLGFTIVPAARAQIFIPIDPTTTYLHVNQDLAGDSSPILLSSLVFNGHALQPGDVVNFSEAGDFLFSIYGTPDFGTGMLGVFSSSSTLLDASLLNRIPDAISAGNDVISLPTYLGNETTDIPEDFLVASGTGTTVTIPNGANYLFLSADDDIFSDNANPHNNFGVQVSYVPPAAVPEASTTASLGLLLVLGSGGLAVSRRRRKGSSLL